MIEHVRTIGFKGFDLNESVPNKVIYSGKNKSGKSTRAGAIALALYGFIPFSTTGKRPSDILESFGNESLIVAVKIKGIEFARKFSRGSKGVSQVMQIDKKKVSSENFAIRLSKVGSPRIANVAEFMKHSEAKKVDTLFELFPNDELAGIDTEIEDAKEDVSRLDKKKIGAESVIVRLTNSKKDIQLPSGSIAEVQDEINKTEIKIVELSEQIKQAEIEEARIEGERIAKEKADQEKERQEKLKKAGEEITHDNHSGHAFVDGSYPEVEARFGSITNENKTQANTPEQKTEQPWTMFNNVVDESKLTQEERNYLPNAGESIERIIGALTGSGCGTCAALIVAKQELKKHKGVQ